MKISDLLKLSTDNLRRRKGRTALTVIPLWLILLALLFATVVGVLSGIAPANRAVKISALEAIRHE